MQYKENGCNFNIRRITHLSYWNSFINLYDINPIIPSVLKTNEIPGGAPGAPPMKNNEGVLLGPYHQKTFLKGTNFRLI